MGGLDLVTDEEECDREVYEKGKGIFILADVSKKFIEWWVGLVRERSEQRVDWHYAGGRGIVMVLGDIHRARSACAELLYIVMNNTKSWMFNDGLGGEIHIPLCYGFEPWQPKPPEDIHCVGELYAPGGDPMCLTDGMMHLHINDELSIDVSWLPEHDPKGRFVVTVYGYGWEDQREEVEFHSMDETARAIEELIEKYKKEEVEENEEEDL